MQFFLLWRVHDAALPKGKTSQTSSTLSNVQLAVDAGSSTRFHTLWGEGHSWVMAVARR